MFICNKEHYEKVRNERARIGLDTHGIRQIDIENSSYLNKYITDKTTNKQYFVERDYIEYSSYGFGWIKVMLLSYNDSHRVIWYENINNDDETILVAIDKCKNVFNFSEIIIEECII